MFFKKYFLHKKIGYPILFGYIGAFILVIIIILISLKSVINLGVSHDDSIPESFSNINLRARSVYVFDSKENKILFTKNETESLPIASITKVMTVYCSVLNNDLDKTVSVSDGVFGHIGSATSTNIIETWSLRDLSIYTLIESSNEGAKTLARASGSENETLKCMNQKAAEMSLRETKFFNVTGLDLDSTHPGAVSSTENVATLLERVYDEYPDIYSKTANSVYKIYAKNGRIHTALNTNMVSDEIVGILASKTGLTDLAGGNLAYVMNTGLNHKVFVAILGSTEAGRFDDALLINRAVLESFVK